MITEKDIRPGAPMERGKIIAEDGKGGYRMESGDRIGIITPYLKPIIDGETYREGEWVYFFLFPDGDGKIMARM